MSKVTEHVDVVGSFLYKLIFRYYDIAVLILGSGIKSV